MTRGARAGLLVAGCVALALPSCGSAAPPATGQVLLFVDTDAPVASPTNPRLGPMDPLPLFDRVRIDVYPPGANAPCSGCSNDFDVDADQLASGASVGLVPPPGVTGYRARVRLYYGPFASAAGEPDPGTTVDVTVALPAVGADGIDQETVFLPTDSVGVPIGSLTAPAAPTPGSSLPSRVGTWSRAARVPCQGAPLADEVCIPGGAYWMGNPLVAGILTDDEGTTPRLVVLSPFYLEKAEVTVGAFRAAGLTPAVLWSGGATGTSWPDWCTFAATARDCSAGFPCDDDVLNCLTVAEGRAFCRLRGGDLPTEAQYEYAAGALQSQRYVWGEDPPACTDALYDAVDANAPLLSDVAASCTATGLGGPAAPGQGTLDRLDVPGGPVVDLAGNVAEWALDAWNRTDEPCWSEARVYVDPVCKTPSPADGPQPTVRGGAWLDDPAFMQAASRSFAFAPAGGASTDDAAVDVGFRCARSAR